MEKVKVNEIGNFVFSWYLGEVMDGESIVRVHAGLRDYLAQ